MIVDPLMHLRPQMVDQAVKGAESGQIDLHVLQPYQSFSGVIIGGCSEIRSNRLSMAHFPPRESARTTPPKSQIVFQMVRNIALDIRQRWKVSEVQTYLQHHRQGQSSRIRVSGNIDLITISLRKAISSSQLVRGKPRARRAWRERFAPNSISDGLRIASSLDAGNAI